MFGFEFQELQRQLVEKLHSLGISLSGLNEFRYKYGRVTSLVALVVVVPILRRRLLLLFKKKSHPRSPRSEGASEIGKNHVGNNSVENSYVGKVKMNGDSFAKGMNAIKSNGSKLTGEVMKKLPEVVPFSVFLKLVEKGKVDKAVLSRDTVSFSTTDVLDALKELGEDYSDIISSRSSSSVSSSAEGNNLQEESVVLMTRPVTIFPELVKMLHSKGVMFDQASPSQWSGLGTVLVMSVPFIYLAIVGAMFYKFYDTGSGGDVGKLNPDGSNAPPADPNSKKGGPTKFADVAGIDDAKAIVAEVSDMLKNPGKYDEVGARLPSGIMLVGPPGTGKTMLARAIANEAGLPFFYCSGSDFVEVYAGRGAARVRKLFERAAKAAPSLVFFDEIDALGKSRSAHELSSNEEREQTLNQLLAAMDGFSSQKNVVVMAATNRFDILDKALVRPGRFDRVVRVNKPDKKGREAILRVHTKQLTLGESVEFEQLAELTLGFTGAELAMLVNEAAIHLAGSSTSSSAGRKQLEQDDFIYALDSFLEARGQKPIWNGNNTSAGSNFGTESLNSFLRFSSSSSSSSSSSTPPALEAALDMMNNGNAGGRGRGRGSSNLNQQQQQQQQQGQQQGQWPRQTHRPHFPNGDNPMSNGHAPGLGELD